MTKGDLFTMHFYPHIEISQKHDSFNSYKNKVNGSDEINGVSTKKLAILSLKKIFGI